VHSLNSHDTLQYDAGLKRFEVEGPEKNKSNGESCLEGNSAAVVSCAKKTLKVRKLSDCTSSVSVHSDHGIRSMCKRFEEKRVEKEEGF
jgi:hypothetical protein